MDLLDLLRHRSPFYFLDVCPLYGQQAIRHVKITVEWRVDCILDDEVGRDIVLTKLQELSHTSRFPYLTTLTLDISIYWLQDKMVTDLRPWWDIFVSGQPANLTALAVRFMARRWRHPAGEREEALSVLRTWIREAIDGKGRKLFVKDHKQHGPMGMKVTEVGLSP